MKTTKQLFQELYPNYNVDLDYFSTKEAKKVFIAWLEQHQQYYHGLNTILNNLISELENEN